MIHLHPLALTGFVLLSSSIFLSACSKDTFSRAGYEAAKLRQCNEQIDNIGCQDNYLSYEEYQRQRSETAQ